jgi:TRAP-type transport system periplasmic protein
MFRKIIPAAVAAAFVVMGTAGTAEAKTTMKFATLAPKQSPWGKVFMTWTKAVKQKTNNEVELEWLWNGTGGPERAVVGKIKSGQYSGAAITAIGLADIHKPIIALQMPGAFSSWATLDAARDKLAPDFEKAMKDNGFHLGGYGDVGIARTMSKGFAVKTPGDLKGKHPAMIREDIIAPKLYEVIGGVFPVPESVTGFLPKLNSGAIDVMTTPSLAAEQLQWSSRLDHMNTNDVSYGMGAMVVSQKELDKLTADQREVMISTGKQASKALTTRIRKEDDASFVRLKGKMKTHDPSPAEKAEWKKVFTEACKRLKSSMPGDVLSKIGAC